MVNRLLMFNQQQNKNKMSLVSLLQGDPVAPPAVYREHCCSSYMQYTLFKYRDIHRFHKHLSSLTFLSGCEKGF